VSRVLVAPGNAGTAREDGLANVSATTIPEWIDIARKESVAFTVVGPEAPLAEGVVDEFRAAGLRIFGPVRSAARLESSKKYAKEFMVRYGIPTAKYAAFDAAGPAHAYVEEHGAPIVIKADGLAAGKGVVVAAGAAEAHAAIELMLSEGKLGAAGSRVVIEECLEGEEASFIALCDGRRALPLATSQDHKRLLDGDRGPNTGGMGAYSPAPVVTPAIHAKAMREVIQPALKGMENEGTPYVGFLYAGLMISTDGKLRVLEFNCRMGDPETQPILMRLKSDLVELVEHALDGTLDRAEAEWDTRVALAVVLASHGYPETPRKGDAIRGIPAPQDDYHVFHAGTASNGTDVVTSGGRVLCVTALGSNVRAAQRRAYEIAEQVRFDGMQYRRDIGHRAVSTGAR
jgi:phosphoribosylamine--glycine ligase